MKIKNVLKLRTMKKCMYFAAFASFSSFYIRTNVTIATKIALNISFSFATLSSEHRPNTISIDCRTNGWQVIFLSAERLVISGRHSCIDRSFRKFRLKHGLAKARL